MQGTERLRLVVDTFGRNSCKSQVADSAQLERVAARRAHEHDPAGAACSHHRPLSVANF